MADNVAITAGSGTVIAADDVSSVFYQRIKLTDGTADSTDPIIGSNYRLMTLPYSPPASIVVGNSGAIASTGSTNVIATAAGANTKYYITDVLVTNGGAAGTLVTVEDDAAALLFQGYAASGGGGFAHNFLCPVPTTNNAHIHAVCAATSSSVYVTVVAFKAP
jgi:hypothetical protein